jgi:hypothetical protein
MVTSSDIQTTKSRVSFGYGNDNIASSDLPVYFIMSYLLESLSEHLFNHFARNMLTDINKKPVNQQKLESGWQTCGQLRSALLRLKIEKYLATRKVI